ncbi:MAPEG family protein [Roseococcus suduntuyensis]|uniref:Glutathione S-transferase n=1 Tax=Roseococcus suduntuyensis TaxID=455361 RepID=A0A840AHD7_9PROT|nr:MAPEG family protein [Roseococcus suduntuyensis]MBB3899900.1 hypothetical protein [Roseococcus suduntuyensis]
MSALPITALYAGLLAFVLLWLSIAVIGHRRRSRVSLGTGEDKALLQATRAHANFCEYTPFGLILLALLEAGGTAGWMLHALGLLLLAGRLAHGVGLMHQKGSIRLRQVGMLCTFTVLILGGAMLVAQGLLG